MPDGADSTEDRPMPTPSNPTWRWSFDDADGWSLFAWLDKHDGSPCVKIQWRDAGDHCWNSQPLIVWLDDQGPECMKSLAVFVAAMRRHHGAQQKSQT